MTIKVTQLHYARAVVDQGSFSRAAAALGVTQPALSTGIAALERVLGGPLFERTTRGAAPTPLGTRLLPHIDRVLAAVDRLVAEARTIGGRGEPLRMGVSPLIHPRLVARAFEAARHGEGAGLVLREDNLARLRAALTHRELDVILTPAVADPQGFRRREIEVEPLRYVGSGLPPDAAGGPPIELAEVASEPQVLVTDECGLTTFVQDLFARGGSELRRYPGAAHSYRNLVEWASLGLGGAILPESRMDAGASTGRPLVEHGRPIRIRYEALWLPGPRAAAVETLLDALLAG